MAYVPVAERADCCPVCQGPPGRQGVDSRCHSCARHRAEAIRRLERLRPVIARIAGALAAVRRITDVTLPPDRSFHAPGYGAETRALLAEISAVEQELDLSCDEWSVLLQSK